MLQKNDLIIVATMPRQRRYETGLGQRLLRLRKGRHITQIELAQAVGVTQGLISLYEKGVTEPSAAVMVALAKVLRVSADDLLGLHGASNSDPNTEDLRLMRKLRRVQSLPVKDRRSVLQFIDTLVAKEEALNRAHA